MKTKDKKSLFDFAIVLSLFWFIIPIFIVVIILIKKQSAGPAFFRQYRVGLNEKLFRIYKFRTMVVNAEKMGTSVTTRHDTRITPFGKILRKTKLDEVPQLLNVLKGDMSLVGPRPEVPEIVDNYTDDMKRIFKVKPGITSLATLHLVDEERILSRVSNPDTFYEEVLVPIKVQMALEQVEQNSFSFDLKILLQTLWMLTFGRWWPIPDHKLINELRERIERGRSYGVI
jgi:lipopolysaccharide/colanic/teichoic acid biosynthesis glycosyltransferase